jgi:hypothetical protein
MVFMGSLAIVDAVYVDGGSPVGEKGGGEEKGRNCELEVEQPMVRFYGGSSPVVETLEEWCARGSVKRLFP